MFKINQKNVEIGTVFYIPNRWLYKITKISNINKEAFLQSFQIIKLTKHGYLCKSSDKQMLIYVSSDIFCYLTGEYSENKDNSSVCLSNYLPVENHKVLIKLSSQNIFPAQFKLIIDFIDDIPSLSFQFINLLTKKNYDIATLSNCWWKRLYGSDMHMNDMEKMYQDTFVHKDLVLCVGEKFAKYLEEKELFEDAKALRNRIVVHDNSKIMNNDEFKALTSIINEKSSLGNANIQLSERKQEVIKLHWKNNPHHPEYYDKYEDMSKIDRMEMVCDWMARSLQYKNDLIDFVKIRQNQRFHFPDSMYDELLNYCEILVSLFQQRST